MSIFKSARKLIFLSGLAASHAEMSPKLAAFMKKSGLKKYCETHGLKEGECIKYVADIDSFARDKIFVENEPNRKKRCFRHIQYAVSLHVDTVLLQDIKK